MRQHNVWCVYVATPCTHTKRDHSLRGVLPGVFCLTKYVVDNEDLAHWGCCAIVKKIKSVTLSRPF